MLYISSKDIICPLLVTFGTFFLILENSPIYLNRLMNSSFCSFLGNVQLNLEHLEFMFKNKTLLYDA